jgi:hypothetical protein
MVNRDSRSRLKQASLRRNVRIRRNSKDLAGEVDVLVIYGEFVLVVQAKSKRVTLKARAGDIEALTADFEGAIQAPYRQALDCVERICAGEKDAEARQQHCTRDLGYWCSGLRRTDATNANRNDFLCVGPGLAHTRGHKTFRHM